MPSLFRRNVSSLILLGICSFTHSLASRHFLSHASRRPLAFPSTGDTRSSLASSSSNQSLTPSKDAEMRNIRDLDHLTVQVLFENECDSMSSAGCDHGFGFSYTPERANLRPHAAQSSVLPTTVTGDCTCRAGHGLSLLLTAHTSNVDNIPFATSSVEGRTAALSDQGSISHTLLLDAGSDADLWKSNADKLNSVRLADIEAAVLSHYHYDHSGGLVGAIQTITDARNEQGKQGPSIVIDLHSSGIVKRGRPSPESPHQVIPHRPDNPTPEQLCEASAGSVDVQLHDQGHTLCDDTFFVSGYIPRDRTNYEKGIPNHLTQKRDSGEWELDEEIVDERYVACKIKNRGWVVFSSCSHAGIINVCRDVLLRSSGNGQQDQLYAVIGGFHLGGAAVEDRIERTVADLQSFNPSVVLAGHCTGWKAKVALANAFPGRFQPLAVGAKYDFDAA
jgi:7,8-dihydropterin-6-yl-methyl-4-(beta-D-ribofuranosyl)aminobenzene 5'-phosphate synthase